MTVSNYELCFFSNLFFIEENCLVGIYSIPRLYYCLIETNIFLIFQTIKRKCFYIYLDSAQHELGTVMLLTEIPGVPAGEMISVQSV